MLICTPYKSLGKRCKSLSALSPCLIICCGRNYLPSNQPIAAASLYPCLHVLAGENGTKGTYAYTWPLVAWPLVSTGLQDKCDQSEPVCSRPDRPFLKASRWLRPGKDVQSLLLVPQCTRGKCIRWKEGATGKAIATTGEKNKKIKRRALYLPHPLSPGTTAGKFLSHLQTSTTVAFPI